MIDIAPSGNQPSQLSHNGIRTADNILKEAGLAKEPIVVKSLKALGAERAKLVRKAREAALGVIRGAIADLKQIGIPYHLVEGPAPRKVTGARKAIATVEVGACPVCGFKTNPPHDGRGHRYQVPKKAFTTPQLKAKGMSKVA